MPKTIRVTLLESQVNTVSRYPERIVCLAAEIPGILHALGSLDRVVGISAYTTGPEEALSLPKVSGFEHGSVDRILQVNPDVAILTSGVQQKLAVALGERGVTVIHLHPHRLHDLYQHVRLLGALVGESTRAEALAKQLEGEVESVRHTTHTLPRHPLVYFEEWMDPLMTGIGWVSDLIEAAGGIDIFRERSLSGRQSKDRVVAPEEWIEAQPDIFLASWCGKPFDLESVKERCGADTVPALQHNAVHEVDGSILQCGVALIDRLHELTGYVREAIS